MWILENSIEKKLFQKILNVAGENPNVLIADDGVYIYKNNILVCKICDRTIIKNKIK